ncbi:alpha beta-hydrolase [Lecanosticta acicola]|uniref:Carboxypeptidase n=1 Tax=Lecanosticta acicola TaxID=111012 RepID=A0AAI9E620_9PEZI|nr:alpha beta-hydrolase [Lecanosticta acicola]
MAALKQRGINVDAALSKRATQPSRPNPNAYLNSKTRPYMVNGSSLPDINFDIGESYSGLLPIDNTKELFFWFVPSTNPAAKNEITIWLNGGPGCSSLDGFLHENGPVIWQAGTYLPVPNTWAWNNLTNMVFIDQPVGTGYSQGTPNATSEIDVADQFLPFWRNFMDLFDLHGREVYVTGESYAGQYCPYITAAMLDKNDTKYFNVNGMMIYDPSIQYNLASQVATIPFIDSHRPDFPFNDTFDAYMHDKSKSCGYDTYISNALQFPPNGHFSNDIPGYNRSIGDAPTLDCDVFDEVFTEIFNINPCFDIYQVGQLCPHLWDVLGFPDSTFYFPVGFTQPYFNRTDVKKLLHVPQSSNWTICTDTNVFLNGTDKSPPSGINGGPLQKVIERTNNVVVGHGALDMVLIANGTLLTLNNLTWNGKQGFSKPPTDPFYVPYHNDPVAGSVAGAGVFGGYVSERGLTFVAVVLSGHEIPEYQPSAAYRHLEFLLGRVKSLDEVSPFTTMPGVMQSNHTLGKGTWWPTEH